MAAFHGIIVYEILENGNLLNAIYANDGLKDRVKNRYDIDNEIARKIPNDNSGLGGVYNCRYIETNNDQVIICTLTITKLEEVYELRWDVNGKTKWVGIGLMAGSSHVAVSYTKP